MDKFERLDDANPDEMELIKVPDEASDQAPESEAPAAEAAPTQESAPVEEATCEYTSPENTSEAAPAAENASASDPVDWMAELDKEVSSAAQTVNKEAVPAKEKKARQPKKTAAAPAQPEPPITKFRYPFNVRYGAEVIQLTGFVDGEEYTADQITEMLVANGYTEFQDMKPSYHFNKATGMLIITIQGSRKGGEESVFWQECNACGKRFRIDYATGDYVDEPCDCECPYSPVDGAPSISEWKEMQARKEG